MRLDHFDAELRAEIAANIARVDRHEIEVDDRRPAAVAIILRANSAGTPCFVMTRRASKLRTHKGQFALPGGRLDKGETPIAAALRETAEEIGLRLAPRDVLGRLDDYATRSGFVMHPVVLWSGSTHALVHNPDEVDTVFEVPLTELDRPDAPRLVDIPESDRPVIQMPMLGHLINAPTAAVMYQMREVGLHGRATRVAHYEQPVWAWR